MGSTGSYVREQMIVRKTVDTNTQNDATYNDDPHLILPIAANEILVVRVMGSYVSGAGGLRVSFNGPAATVNIMFIWQYSDAAGAVLSGFPTFAWDGVTSIVGAVAGGIINGFLCVENGVNAGNIIFRWAQQAANGANTTIYRGTWMESKRMA